MKITKRRIRSILKEITPGAAGIAATGGGTPADQGFAAAQADDASRTALADAWSLLEELEEELWIDSGQGKQPRDTFEQRIAGEHAEDLLGILRKAMAKLELLGVGK